MDTFAIFLLAYFIEAIILWIYAETFFSFKFTVSRRVFSLTCLYTGLFLFSLLNLSALNLFLYSLINLLFLHTFYKTKWYISVFHTIILSALMSACELFSIGIISFFTPTFLQYYEKLPYSLIFVLFSKGLFFIAVYLLTFFFNKNTKHLQKDWHSLLLLFTPIATMFTLITLIHIGESFTLSSSMNSIISLSAILLLISNIFAFWINQYTQNKAAKYTDIQLLLQKESDTAAYYQMLLSQHENQRILIHDIKKHLQSIEILNASKCHQKIDTYIHTLLQSSALTESDRICDNHMLNVILSRYKYQCQEKNIVFHADIRCRVLCDLPDSDLTTIFCNILDNAMEAAAKAPNSMIELNVYRKEKTPFTIITLINSCIVNPFTAHTHQLISTKKDLNHHGLGLKSVRRIAERYHGNMKVYYDENDSLFHTIIMIPQTSPPGQQPPLPQSNKNKIF